MPTKTPSEPLDPERSEHAFVYRGHAFRLEIQSDRHGQYIVGVEVVSAPHHPTRLVQDADPYATAVEALRHGQQQAMRWVHERSGGPQGRSMNRGTN